MQEAGWPKEKLINIPTFTDINKFQPTSDFKKSNYICYLGRLDEPKGIDILIKAFSKIKKQTSTDLVLKIAGKGSQFYTEKLKKTAKENGLDNSIHFVGQLDNIKIPNFLGNALLTVVPSLWYENLPNSILESYSCGTPVVASDLGSLSGCVTQGITGSLFKTGSTNELAKKIWLLLDDKNLLAEMAINSRIEALDKYSPKTHMGLLEDLFNKLIK
ncbi:MAG: glycosyltransferase [Desulfobacteraceae bacterium]|nr:glycosyltransferase [Desulfobacteraceae bacterium]